MAQTVGWGTAASFTFSSSVGFLAAAARVSLRQGIATATGFGKTWRIKHGTVQDYSVSVSGVLTYGTTSDQPPGTMSQVGVAITVTFAPGCTFADTMVQSSNDLGTSIESAGDASYSYEGPTSFSGPTLTWATS